MSDLTAKMHQIRFPLGLRLDPAGGTHPILGELTALSMPQLYIRGLLLREGRGGKREGKESRRKGRRREGSEVGALRNGKPTACKVASPPLNNFIVCCAVLVFLQLNRCFTVFAYCNRVRFYAYTNILSQLLTYLLKCYQFHMCNINDIYQTSYHTLLNQIFSSECNNSLTDVLNNGQISENCLIVPGNCLLIYLLS